MIKNIFKKAAAVMMCLCIAVVASSCSAVKNTGSDSFSVDESVDGYVPYDEDTSNYKIITYASSTLPTTIDPAKTAVTSMDAQFVYNTSEGLLRFYNNAIAPGIAEKWETTDNITYTFTLRNACWEDGTLITANDFVYTLKRLLNPDTGAAVSDDLLLIKNAISYRAGNSTADDLGIQAVDAKTLKITLEEANPVFLEMLAQDTQAYLVREDIVHVCGDTFATNPGTYLSCGPFMVKSWNQNEIVLEKNNNYWDSENIKLNRIVCKLVPDGATRAVMYDAGECNAYIEMLNSNIKNYSNYNTMQESTLVSLHENIDKAVFQNDKFRKAISYAINRDEIISEDATPGSVAATRFVPDSFGSFTKTYPIDNLVPTGGDANKAKELLNEALTEMSITAADIGEIVFVCQDTDASKSLANNIISMLRDNLGLTEIRLVSVPAQTAAQYYCSGNFDLYIQANTGTCINPYGQLSRWKSNSIYNLAGWTSETLDSYLSSYATNSTVSNYESLSSAEKLLLDYSPEIPLYYRGFIYGYSDSISNIGLSSVGVKMQLIYADVKNT